MLCQVCMVLLLAVGYPLIVDLARGRHLVVVVARQTLLPPPLGPFDSLRAVVPHPPRMAEALFRGRALVDAVAVVHVAAFKKVNPI